MKHLVIIGAGGMGRSIYCIAKGCIGYNTDFDIKGFIDDDISSLDSFNNYPPVLSSIKDYKIKEDDVFTCSIGDVETKINICRQLINRGATFYTLIHKNSL
ncbi:MAG: hypothetical protein PHH79_09095, partial [Aminobacterium colombiense]|nr:hypothetical protein [Aminobacterium colombiense]